MNKLIKIILCVSINLLFLSCGSDMKQSPNILRLDKLTTVYGISRATLSEKVIIENHPLDKNKLDSLMDNYIKNKSLIFALDSFNGKWVDINMFFISFFKKTRCTEYYIDSGEDKRHEIYGDGTGRNRDCSEDRLGFFSYYRSKEDSTIWYCDYPKSKTDTIWLSNR